MKCREAQRRISAYVDGELPESIRAAMLEHFQQCRSCCDALADAMWFETVSVTSMRRRMVAPVAIRYNVLNALQREAVQPTVGIWQRVLRQAAPFGVTACLVLLGLHANQRNEPVVVRAPEVAVQAPTVVQPALKPAAKPTPRPVHVVSKPEVKRPAPSVVTPSVPVAPKSVRMAINPKPAPTAPVTVVEPSEVGFVTEINGRLLSQRNDLSWEDAGTDTPLLVRGRLRSAANTVASFSLYDGTIIKSNHDTEFEVLRSPTDSEPEWVLRLVRGEIFVNAKSRIRVMTPGSVARASSGEFSVRSIDGSDTAILALTAEVLCASGSDRKAVKAGFATSTLGGSSLQAPFEVLDMRTQLDWAYIPAAPYDPLNSGGTQS